MGMFDHVQINVPMPDPAHDGVTWQTKDFEKEMDMYVVKSDGRLFIRCDRLSKPTESGMLRMAGHVDTFLEDFSGDIHATTVLNYEPIAYRLAFANGTLTSIARADRRYCRHCTRMVNVESGEARCAACGGLLQ